MEYECESALYILLFFACISPSGVQSKIRVLGNQEFLALPLSPEVTLGLSVKWR